MALHIADHRAGFPPGITYGAGFDELEADKGFALAVNEQTAGDVWDVTAGVETPWLQMSGAVEVELNVETHRLECHSLFEPGHTWTQDAQTEFWFPEELKADE